MFTYISGPCGPDKVWGHVCQCVGLCATPMHWQTFALPFWSMWSRNNLGEMYANACSCMQPPCIGIRCPYFPGHMAQTKHREKYANACGCMLPHSSAYISPTVLGHMAQTSRGEVCQCMGATCTHLHGHTFPLLSGPHGPDK